MRWAASLLAALVCFSTVFAAGTPLRIVHAEQPRFPDALLLNDAIREGDVTLLITVDATGQLTDALVVRDTHEAFGTEALATIKLWRFEPARVDEQPVPTRTQVQLHFAAPLAVVDMSANSTINSLAAFAGSQKGTNERICLPSELDAPPHVLRSPAPRPQPVAAGAPARPATHAVIDFILDATGRPRMPVLISASDQLEGVRAAEALLQWQFDPPTRRGRPVAVRVRQEFIFPAKKT